MAEKKQTKKAPAPKQETKETPEMDMKSVPLGTKLRDRVTGFVGISTAKVIYLNGCVQYSLKPSLDKDGKIQDAQFFDSQQLEFVDEGILTEKMKEETKKPTGGVMPDLPKLQF